MAGEVGMFVPWEQRAGAGFCVCEVSVGPAFPLQGWDDPDERAVPVPPSHAGSLRLPAARGGSPLVPGSLLGPVAPCSDLSCTSLEGNLHQTPPDAARPQSSSTVSIPRDEHSPASPAVALEPGDEPGEVLHWLLHVATAAGSRQISPTESSFGF